VSHRFQIQDIVAQDELGVQFRALDTESGRTVGLRRFFPFGLDGGGLEESECHEYQRGVAEMAALKHPALRAVLEGGCDPVDGVPFLVTEWIDGELLSSLLEHGEFDAGAAVELLDRALQLCEVISAKLGVEAMWLETTPAMVVLDGAAGGRGFTFGISPVRWLVESQDRRSLLPLVTLAEELMGWRGQLVGDQAGGGLGGWLKWLRGTQAMVSLAEARRMLAVMTGRAPAEPVSPTSPPPVGSGGGGTVPAAALAGLPPTAGSKRQLVWIGVLLCLVALAAWWAFTHPRGGEAPSTSAAVPQDAESKRVAEINARAAELVRQAAAGSESRPEFQVADTQALLNEKGKEVAVVGELKRLRLSNSKKTLFLEFADEDGGTLVRGRVELKDAGPNLSEESLKELIGKRIRLSGLVKPANGNPQRPEVVIKDRKSIEEVP
jgi:type II secretory pathway component PulM